MNHVFSKPWCGGDSNSNDDDGGDSGVGGGGGVKRRQEGKSRLTLDDDKRTLYARPNAPRNCKGTRKKKLKTRFFFSSPAFSCMNQGIEKCDSRECRIFRLVFS